MRDRVVVTMVSDNKIIFNIVVVKGIRSDLLFTNRNISTYPSEVSQLVLWQTKSYSFIYLFHISIYYLMPGMSRNVSINKYSNDTTILTQN